MQSNRQCSFEVSCGAERDMRREMRGEDVLYDTADIFGVVLGQTGDDLAHPLAVVFCSSARALQLLGGRDVKG